MKMNKTSLRTFFGCFRIWVRAEGHSLNRTRCFFDVSIDIMYNLQTIRTKWQALKLFSTYIRDKGNMVGTCTKRDKSRCVRALVAFTVLSTHCRSFLIP